MDMDRYDLLTSTGDSRIRLWRLDSFENTAKFKGHICDSAQIAADFSEDGRCVSMCAMCVCVYVGCTCLHVLFQSRTDHTNIYDD